MIYKIVKDAAGKVVAFGSGDGYDPFVAQGNTLELIENYVHTKTLPELKADKNAEINTARLSANQTTFTHATKTFSCDQLSRSDIDGINGYVATRNALPAGWVGGWKAVDNSILPIPDVATWNAFYDSLIAQGQANFVHSQTLKAALANATTQAEIDAIAW